MNPMAMQMIVNMFGSMQNFQQQYGQLQQQMQQYGTNPQQAVMQLMQSGKMSQEQFNMFAQQATQLTGRRPF